MNIIKKIKTITNAMAMFDFVSITEKLVIFGFTNAAILNTLISTINTTVCIK